ncbi:MAG TPA: hypothetical protein VFV94_02830 [Polyangiaceae bacterium]|nr:hypothetical protein [Polyangiaceae bacterium]
MDHNLHAKLGRARSTERRLLRYGSFESIADLRDQVLAFIRYWNRFEARPFHWKFSGKFVRPNPLLHAA